MSTASRPDRAIIARILLLMTALLALSRPLFAQETITLAIYQFRPENIAAMGFESDVMLAIRNEMGNRNRVQLVPKRDMEDALSRRGLAQEFTVDSAVQGGRLLSVRYVLVGSVSKQGGQINASLMLVDVSSGQQIGTWNTAYRTRNEINKTASTLVADIVATTDRGYAAYGAGSSSTASINPAMASGGAVSGGVPAPPVTATAPASSLDVQLQARAKRDWIELSWQGDNADEILGYNVYRSEVSGGPFSLLASTDVRSYTDREAEPGVTYFYQIGAVNIEGVEERARQTAEASMQEMRGSTSINPPLITTLKPLAGGAQLEFVGSLVDGSAPPVKFRVYRARDDLDWQVIGQVELQKSGSRNKSSSSRGLTRHTYTDTELPAAGDYQYAVSAIAADGSESAFSDSFDHSLSPLPALEVPRQGLLRSSQLRWSASEYGLGYRLYRREPGGSWVQVAEVAGVQNQAYTDAEGLQDGKQYEYSYAVYDELSESAKSAPTLVETKPPLSAPEGLLASKGEARQVSLQWEALEDADLQSYVVYRTDYTDEQRFDMEKLAEIDAADGVKFVDTGEQLALQDGAQYLYAIASRNRAGGEGPISLAVEASTKTPPEAAVGLATDAVEGDIVVTWEYTGEDLGAFILSRRWDGGEWHVLAEVAPDAREYTDSTLRPYARADYQLVVVDTTELLSEPVQHEGQQSPAAVELRTGEEPLLRRSELSWNEQALVDGYEIRRRQLPDGEWGLVETVNDPTASAYVDQNGLLDGVEYAYKVSPLADARSLGESNTATSTTKLVTAPGSVEASEGIARQVVLRWPAAEDADVGGYVIYRGKGIVSQEQMEVYTELDGAQTQEFVDTGLDGAELEHGVSYSYSVAARNTLGGVGPAGEVVTGSSKPLPEPVYNLVTFAEEDQVKVSWEYENQDNVSEFHLYRRYGEDEWSALASQSETEFVATELKPYVPIQFRVVVEDVDALLSTETESEQLTSPAEIELELSADNQLRQVHLSWDAQHDIDGYTLQRRQSAEQSWAEVRKLRGADTVSYVDKKGLEDGLDYEYRLLAVDDKLELGASNTITGHTKDLPPAPLEVSAESGLVAEVQVRWQPQDDEDVGGYTIYRVEDGELKKLATVKGYDSAEYLDDGSAFDPLEHGSEYSYAVAAYNTYRVEGERSELVTGSTKQLPTPVTGVEAQQEQGVVSLSWNANPEQDIDHYVVARSSRSNCSSFSTVARVPASAVEFQDEDTRPESSYCYRVMAVDADSLQGGHSSVVEISVPALVSIE